MDAFAIAKLVAGVVGSVCGGSTVGIVLKQLVPEGLSVADKVAVAIGSAAIGGVVGSACAKDIRETMDTAKEVVDKCKNKTANQEA